MIGLLALAALAGASPYQYALAIDPSHRLVEGIATDGKAIFVSSALDRQVLRCTRTCKRFAILPRGLHPLGMAWDSKRSRLWVTADCPELPGVVKCSRGALIGYDQAGRQRTRIASASGDFHPGDVSASDGEVFVSDSLNGAIYRLNGSASAFSTVVPVGVGRSAQGSAYDPAQNRVVVADYGRGVGTIDLKTGARTILKREDGDIVRGIDGLVRCGSSWFGVYNGQQPGRVVQMTIDGDRIATRTLLEGGPLYDPTQLAVRGGHLLVVADAGWNEAAKDAPRARPATILEIPLDSSCD